MAIALSAAGCRKAEAVTDRLLYLDSATGPGSAHVGQPVVYTISGHKPDPAWVVDPPVVERKGDTITVAIVGHRAHKGMAVQMLVPFTTTATLFDLPAGSFTVVIKGRQATLKRHLDIRL